MKRFLLTLMIGILLSGIDIVSAQETLTALQIIENNYNREDGNDETSDLIMTLINKSGDSRVRKVRQYTKEYGGDEKTVVFFLAPADVLGTSFMSWTYADENKDDDQWIYLPALKRIKRISSESKSDYFMGSDFTYDDIGDRLPNEDTHKLLRSETVDGQDCYVVESIPKEKDSIYSKTISWVIKSNWIYLKREYYDEEGDLLKIDHSKKIEQVDGIWTVMHRVMENVQSNHKTDLVFSNYRYNISTPDDMFTERTLKRGL